MNQLNIRLQSTIMKMKMSVCVLVPNAPFGMKPEEFYTEGKKYPVLWLLHGATCDYEDYLQNDSVAKLVRGKNVIVVMPNALNSDYANHMEFATGYAYTDFFFDELMPFIYSTFPASSDPKDNYIAGYSMGGAGAFMLGLYKPEKFGGIAPLGSGIRESEFLKPYLDMTGEEFRKLTSADPTKFPTEFGDPRFGITLKEINMICRYPTVRDYVDSMECTCERFADIATSGRLPEVFFCCGSEDFCCDKVVKFVEEANAIGADNVVCKVIDGYDHSNATPTIAAMIEHYGF